MHPIEALESSLEAIRFLIGKDLADLDIESSQPPTGAERTSDNEERGKYWEGQSSLEKLGFVMSVLKNHTKNATVQEQGLSVICNMAHVAELRAPMRDKMVLQMIVETLRCHIKHAGVTELCCVALRNLSAGDAENKQLLGELGACALVVEAMVLHAGSELIQRLAAAAIWNMTAGNNRNKQLSGMTALDVLVNVLRGRLRSASTNVLESVLGALASILPPAATVMQYEDASQELPRAQVEPYAPTVIACIRKHSDNVLIQQRALSVLLSLCKNIPLERQVLVHLRRVSLRFINLRCMLINVKMLKVGHTFEARACTCARVCCDCVYSHVLSH